MSEQIVARYIDAAVAQTGGMENGLQQRVPELEILNFSLILSLSYDRMKSTIRLTEIKYDFNKRI